MREITAPAPLTSHEGMIFMQGLPNFTPSFIVAWRDAKNRLHLVAIRDERNAILTAAETAGIAVNQSGECIGDYDWLPRRHTDALLQSVRERFALLRSAQSPAQETSTESIHRMS